MVLFNACVFQATFLKKYSEIFFTIFWATSPLTLMEKWLFSNFVYCFIHLTFKGHLNHIKNLGQKKQGIFIVNMKNIKVYGIFESDE